MKNPNEKEVLSKVHEALYEKSTTYRRRLLRIAIGKLLRRTRVGIIIREEGDFLDTSYFIAYLNKKDKYHDEALKLSEKVREYEAVITDYVFDELITTPSILNPIY